MSMHAHTCMLCLQPKTTVPVLKCLKITFKSTVMKNTREAFDNRTATKFFFYFIHYTPVDITNRL